MTTPIDFKAQLIAEFQLNETRMNGESRSSLHQRRRQALTRFEQLGFPTIKHEEWKYSNVKNLVNQAFNITPVASITDEDLVSLQIPNLAGNILYFINGQYQPQLSTIVSPSEEVEILPFTEGYKKYPELVEKHFAQYADDSKDAFTALNTAFAQNGAFIYVPKGKVVETPIILRFISDARTENVAIQLRNLIIVGDRAEVKVAESFRTLGEFSSFTNTVTEAFVGEEAHFDHYKVQDETQKAYHIGTTQVQHSRASQTHDTTVTLNGGWVRNNLNLVLNGEHVEAHLNGLYLPNGRQHIDNHTLVDHAMPNSYSNELYKGIIFDQATGVFNGKIFVREDAQKTNAYQSCKNVLASPEATMNTKPQLEIYADDVKCSHGTTTGQMDEEALFYLQSRGVPKEKGRALLMLAFAEDVVERIKIPAIREYLENALAKKVGEV
ncbi:MULTISPECIES: Fe-S cluster assembly protein SufD [Siphonobacter]|uniref:Fe-S cluster assembly protein SufD n=1 Tax=Siphonobacter curvatus TaxID=2094562 RepID=A0A2S7IN86_9BACT|nr:MULTISPECIES: Fe-S cluster assembly protein SufD [Siphonobacter]PMD95639.1 Fe-S cluster assembly protein SufD [Siphonobacter sp. BAB-5405]PQA59119.1 Fe-S cluster assembly protein SufD [Siphonobacter curvatus]